MHERIHLEKYDSQKVLKSVFRYKQVTEHWCKHMYMILFWNPKKTQSTRHKIFVSVGFYRDRVQCADVIRPLQQQLQPRTQAVRLRQGARQGQSLLLSASHSPARNPLCDLLSHSFLRTVFFHPVFKSLFLYFFCSWCSSSRVSQTRNTFHFT